MMITDYELGKNIANIESALVKQRKFNAEIKRVVNTNARILRELQKYTDKKFRWAGVSCFCLLGLFLIHEIEIQHANKRLDELENQLNYTENEAKNT